MWSAITSAATCLERLRVETIGDRVWLYAASGAGVLLIIYLARRNRRAGKPLPGPLFAAVRSNEIDVRKMEAMVKKYGPLVNFRMLGINILFLCDVDSIRDALAGQGGDIFAGRVHAPLISCINKDCGVLFIDGPRWQEHRRFVLSVLRTFGFGKNITERIIQDELNALRDELSKVCGSSVYPRMQLVRSVSNVICLLVFGKRLGADSDFDYMVSVTNDAALAPAFNNFFLLFFYRLALLLPGDYFKLKKYFSDMTVIQGFMEQKIEEHRKTIDWDNEGDLIDAYLVEMRKREQENPGGHTFTEFQLFRVIVELFLAGMETTSNTLTWALYLMAKYPEFQKRAQQEIDDEIGDKVPQISDRSKLVYTTAVLHEIERYATVVPFSVAHRVTEDTLLRGYCVPKDTIVVPYLFGAHYDGSVWKSPLKFDPSHFYDETNKSLMNLQNLIPFGVGKRSCLGESLATQELFVFFTGLLQRFSFEADPNSPLPEVAQDKIESILRFVSEYRVVIREHKIN